MAQIGQPGVKEIRSWTRWVKSRPVAVREVAERFPPWELFRLKPTGQRVIVASFFENGTVSVDILGAFNHMDFERCVFGIDPNDLEPCELPAPGEVTGAIMTARDVQDNIDAIRCDTRPDLFVMGHDGTAQRRN